jgi:hypothetical protein
MTERADPAQAITVRLFGGAGNQLFQYAAGRALADHLGCPLALDSRYVASSRTRRDDCFGHFANARFTRDINLPPAKHDSALRYALWRTLGRNPRFHREAGLGFDPQFFDLRPGTYLHGYWQSPRYFGDADRLRSDLAMTTPLDAENTSMAARITSAAVPVSFHVRRGDYTAGDSYAACPADYYRRAADALSQQTGQPLTCFVFSNDPTWASDNLSLGHETVIVDLNDEATGHFDMALMAACTHNVIANSTFSWWGAWLNPNPDKTVIAPAQWFAKDKLHNPDLCPPEWLRL